MKGDEILTVQKVKKGEKVSLVIDEEMMVKVREVMKRYGFTKSVAIRFVLLEGFDALADRGVKFR